MTNGADDHLPTPINDNNDPLARIDTGLLLMYRLRRQMLDCDLSGLAPGKRREHWDALRRLDKVIGRWLPYLSRAQAAAIRAWDRGGG